MALEKILTSKSLSISRKSNGVLEPTGDTINIWTDDEKVESYKRLLKEDEYLDGGWGKKLFWGIIYFINF